MMGTFRAVAPHGVLPASFLYPMVELLKVRVSGLECFKTPSMPLAFPVFPRNIFSQNGVTHLVIKQGVQPAMVLSVI